MTHQSSLKLRSAYNKYFRNRYSATIAPKKTFVWNRASISYGNDVSMNLDFLRNSYNNNDRNNEGNNDTNVNIKITNAILFQSLYVTKPPGGAPRAPRCLLIGFTIILLPSRRRGATGAAIFWFHDFYVTKPPAGRHERRDFPVSTFLCYQATGGRHGRRDFEVGGPRLNCLTISYANPRPAAPGC